LALGRWLSALGTSQIAIRYSFFARTSTKKKNSEGRKAKGGKPNAKCQLLSAALGRTIGENRESG
jgi:hypothetical protein